MDPALRERLDRVIDVIGRAQDAAADTGLAGADGDLREAFVAADLCQRELTDAIVACGFVKSRITEIESARQSELADGSVDEPLSPDEVYMREDSEG